MGQKARYRPQRLAAKLLQIRRGVGLSQPQLARLLNIDLTDARICEYEKGIREPGLITLLAYGYLIGVSTDRLIDDGEDLPARISIKKRRKKITLLA